MSIKLFDIIKAVKDVPEQNIKIGMIGTVLEILHNQDTYYEVEFSDPEGTDLLVAYLYPDQVEKATKQDLENELATKPNDSI